MLEEVNRQRKIPLFQIVHVGHYLSVDSIGIPVGNAPT